VVTDRSHSGVPNTFRYSEVMAASTMGTALAVLVALLATAATAQQIPSSSDCLARTQSIGENNLLLRYARDKHSSLKRGDVGNVGHAARIIVVAARRIPRFSQALRVSKWCFKPVLQPGALQIRGQWGRRC
jgi:hypothetical protein